MIQRNLMLTSECNSLLYKNFLQNRWFFWETTAHFAVGTPNFPKGLILSYSSFWYSFANRITELRLIKWLTSDQHKNKVNPSFCLLIPVSKSKHWLIIASLDKKAAKKNSFRQFFDVYSNSPWLHFTSKSVQGEEKKD